MDHEKRGRPISGSEPKTKMMKFRIEPTLYDELVYACRRIGVPISMGVRIGIIMFIKKCSQGYR